MATGPDETVLRAMAGVATDRPAGTTFGWEGLWYRAQPERAELRRLEGVRRRQRGRSLDVALRECRGPAEKERHGCAAAVGEALTSLVYAAHLGEPDSPALRGEDPARRHEFLPDAWALPGEVFGPGVPWHVKGSLVGLETALARLSLHRLDADALPERTPVIDEVQRTRLVLSVALANPLELRDADQAVLASAVSSGRRRVQRLAPASPELEAVARDAGLDPWRARALEWLLEHDRDALPAFFSLGELAYLGAPSGGSWDGWGAADPDAVGPAAAPAAPASARRQLGPPAGAGARRGLRRSLGARGDPSLGAWATREPRARARLDAAAGPVPGGPADSPGRPARARRVGARPAGREARRRGGVPRGPRPAPAGPGTWEDALRARSLVALVALVSTAPSGLVGQAQPRLVIVEPAPGRYVSGPQVLRARLDPEGPKLVRLLFTADGHPVCARQAPPWECEWDAGDDVVSHNIRAVAVFADGSRLIDSVRTEAAGFAPAVAVDVVQVAATVTDGGGRLVKGLGLADFRIFEDERPQPVTHFIGAEAERELVVAVDMSGSMDTAMPTCREAVKRFLATVRPVDHATLLAFNDSVFTVARRDATPEARLRALDRLRAWGSTAFHDALLRGLDLLESHRGRRALILFSDGEDMVSYATAADVQARVEVSATPVYVIAQGKGMREQRLKQVLDRIAGVSGGRAFYTDGVEELDGVFAEIGEDIASQYLLAYTPLEATADGSWRAIRVEVSGRSKKHAVRARQGYRAVPRAR